MFFRQKRRLVGRVIGGAFLVMFCFVLSPNASIAQDLPSLLDRIERLERDIRTLNTQFARGEDAVIQTSGDSNLTLSGGVSSSGVARIDARISSLEDDVRSATSVMESLDRQIFELTTRLDKLVSDMDFRLAELERGNGNGITGAGMISNQVAGTGITQGSQVSAGIPTAEVTQDVAQTSNGVLGTITESELQGITSQPAPTSSVVSQASATETTTATNQASAASVAEQAVGTESIAALSAESDTEGEVTPKDKYTQAFGLLRQAKYDDAASALETFLQEHPEDVLAANARYWLGETFYVRSQFVRAAEVFFEGYKTSPDGPKAPDTLLKLGMSLGNLGKNAEACAAFAKLASDFPNASANVRNTMERERLRNSC